MLPQPASLRKRYLAAFAPSDATIRRAEPTWHRRGPVRQSFYEGGLERHRWPRDSSRVASPPACLEAVIFPSSSFTPKGSWGALAHRRSSCVQGRMENIRRDRTLATGLFDLPADKRIVGKLPVPLLPEIEPARLHDLSLGWIARSAIQTRQGFIEV